MTTDADRREIGFRPVVTDEIEAEIWRLTAETNEISDDLERRRDEVREELEELRTRIDRIEDEAVEYFEECTDFLVVALLPENAEAIDDSHDRSTSSCSATDSVLVI